MANRVLPGCVVDVQVSRIACMGLKSLFGLPSKAGFGWPLRYEGWLGEMHLLGFTCTDFLWRLLGMFAIDMADGLSEKLWVKEE